MAAIQDLEPLGYKVGIAFGSVKVEEDALAAAQADAVPAAVVAVASTITQQTLSDYAAAGQLPDSDSRRAELASKIALAALEMVTTTATERVDFHQRAVAEAMAMADVWVVQQFVNDALVFQTYVSTKADGTGWDDDSQAQLDALANPDGYAEREYQALNPEAMQAAQTLASLGRVCARPTPGADTFTVDGATVSGAELVKLAEQAASEPPPLSQAERIVAALAGASEISPEVQAALRDAVASSSDVVP